MTTDSAKLTPAMRQFNQLKAKYPECVLFFRMGDFYETFYEDAQICSQVLGLALTSRSKGDNPVPLAGVPYHAVEGYLKKMLQAGYKVAVCEQMEDAKSAKGLVKRDVVRVVTPGTLTDEVLLEEKRSNYLCAVSLGAKSAAMSWADVSTGHFFCQQVGENELVDELLRLGPAECLVPQTRGDLFAEEMKKLSKQIGQLTDAVITERPAWYFDPYQAEKRLLKHFGTSSLEGFGISDGEVVIGPAGAIIEYLNETQKTAINHICSLRKVNRAGFLYIDQTTLRSLEILRTMRTESVKGSLLDCLDQTLTGMGGRKFHEWLCRPLCDVGAIELRQDAVEELMTDGASLAQVRSVLSEVCDIERVTARITTIRATPRDLVALGAALRRVPTIRQLLEGTRADLLLKLARSCDSMDELAGLLQAAMRTDCPGHLRDGGVIKAGFDQQLDGLRSICRDGQSWLSQYQRTEIQRTGINNLRIGFNKVFGYYIEVSRSAADRVPADYVRKQTIKNAERYVTEQLKKYEEQALGAREKAIELEQRLFERVRVEAAGYVPRLQNLADCLAMVDSLCALAELARRRNYIRPKVTDSGGLRILEGKHPVLLERLGAEFVPNDVQLGEGAGDVAIITGPNMSGKSTYIRQVALLVIMAQMGSFIPAKEAEIGLVDRVFTRVGASDELVRGQSTFMVEMIETADIVNNATARSLVVLDEVGRGTSTYDGLALAWALTEHVANNIRCRTLFATHFHELTELEQLLVNVRNFNVAVREWMDEVVFLHKILPGGTDKSYGIYVAKLAGVPRAITERSKEILAELETTFAREASGEHLASRKTRAADADSLFVQQRKSILEKLATTDVDNLTPIEAINLLNKIKQQLGQTQD
jgi:DNA mismatch repair protein MutS